MCASNPQMELYTIWGFTHEEVLNRWTIWKRFDIVTRIFGSGKDSEKEAKAATPVNDASTMMALTNLFGSNFMQAAPSGDKPI